VRGTPDREIVLQLYDLKVREQLLQEDIDAIEKSEEVSAALDKEISICNNIIQKREEDSAAGR
jgi:hypothetical protein